MAAPAPVRLLRNSRKTRVGQATCGAKRFLTLLAVPAASLALLIGFWVVLGTAAWAEAPLEADAGTAAGSPGAAATPAPAPAATSAPTVMKIGDVVITGSLRARLYVWDWFQPVSGQNQYQYSGNLLRVNLAEQKSAWDWDAEFAVPFLLGLPNKAVDAAPQGALGLGANYYSANNNSQYTASIFPKQLYVRLKKLGGHEGQTLQVGRFLFLDGNA